MKIILGLNAFHADTSACVIKNNKIVAAIEEERISRIKHTSDFPINAINECLKIAGINFKEITNVSINSDPKKNLHIKVLHFAKNFEFKKVNNLFVNRFINKIYLKGILEKNFELNKNLKINNIEHHISHLSSAFFASGFEKSIGLSIDGSGDFSSLVIAECNSNKIKVLNRIYFPHSLGLFYQGMTQLIGFNKYGDEYKLMGLAPYGKPIYKEKIHQELFKDSKKIFNLNLKNFNHHKLNFNYDISEDINIDKILSKNFCKLFKFNSKNNDEIEEFKKNVAASTQNVFEFYLGKILKYLKKLNYSKNIVYAGGCALNSSANNLLLKDQYFENIFIPFAPADNGGAIGSAIYTYYSNGNENKINNINSPYLGNSYESNYIGNKLSEYSKKYNLKIQEFKNFNELCDQAVEDLMNNCVLGWFQGEMEFGPRSLGNRSILADPRKANMKDIINRKIKKRENFRPFAPSVLMEYQNDWFQKKFDNFYMSSVMDVKMEKKNLIPAVVHIDGTSRVQTVCKDNNNKFHYLINKFYNKTGVPMLLNTSFNENEPIVRKPQEAIECLLRTNMDSLYIDKFIVKKIK